MADTSSGCSQVLGILLLLTATLTNADLSLVTTEGEFVISFDGNEVFHHTIVDPIIWVGYGSTNFTESLGNFEVEDEVLTKVPLVQFEVADNSPDLITLHLQPAESDTVDITLVVKVDLQADDSPSVLMHTEYSIDNNTFNRMWVRFSAEQDEQVWGGGEQYTYLNLRGHYFPIWTSEQGVGRDGGIIANISDLDGGAGGHYYTTYWPQASFLSSRRYSIIISSYSYMVLNFTEEARHEVYIHSLLFDSTMVWGSSLLKTVQVVTTRLGPQPLLPDWILTGTCLAQQRGTQEMLYYYELAKTAGVNVTSLWIQDWSGTTETFFGHRVYWNWRWNQTYYPDLNVAIQDLLEEGVRVMAYINPHLIEGSDMFLEAASLGYLMRDADGQPYRQDFGGFLAGTIDLFNSEAKDWYRDEMIRNMVELGLGGWMADFGEYTPLDMFTSDPLHDLEAEERHNQLPVQWASCNREVLEASGQLGHVVPFMRSGGLGSSKYQVLAWAGDQNVDWSLGDGVASTVIAALNLGMSGMGITHFDIGGYTTMPPLMVRSKELFLRAAEYAVFTPVMRTHEGNKPEANHQYYSDDDTLFQFARLTQIHSRLLPYTRSLIQELSTAGTPVQRPLFLDFEEDVGSWDIMYQYLYGPDLLVAPVIHKGQETQTVYLPGGGSGWVYFWEVTEEAVVGPVTVTVPVPMGYPAVYYRKDSPWQPLFQEIAQEFGLATEGTPVL